MTAEALPAEVEETQADPPEVAAVAVMLRQLWPNLPEMMAQRHARTFVRINSRHYGPADEAAAGRMLVTFAGSPAAEVVTIPDDFCTEAPRQPGLFLRKWHPDNDRRPGPGRYDDPRWQIGGDIYAQQMRGGKLYCGSAKHGECTPCIKEGRLRQALYRLSDANDTYSRSSLCGPCARKMLGTPVVVPKFDTPEQAQAWLDAQE